MKPIRVLNCFILLFISLGLILILNPACAQLNLVPNPSFETFSTCPDSGSEIGNATPWFQPFLPNGSTDYFNCCSATSTYSVPDNYSGFQFGFDSCGYAGISTGVFNGNNYREYLEVELIDSLIGGFKYYVSFYISCSDNAKRAGDGIGAFLSNSIVLYNSPLYGVLSQYSPQLKNTTGNILSDTINWVLISDTITAQGGERFITIGNFKPDSATNWITVNPNGLFLASYYYIDNVSVILCDSTTGIEVLSERDVTISPNPASARIRIGLAHVFQHEATLKIFSSIGALLMESEFREELDVGMLPKGIYFLSVETKKGRVVKKVIVD